MVSLSHSLTQSICFCFCLVNDKISLKFESQNYGSYRNQAVNSISEALHASLNEEKVRENCCEALLILAGHFSSTGKVLTKSSILKEVGYMVNSSEVDSSDHEEEDLLWDNGTISFVSFLP